MNDEIKLGRVGHYQTKAGCQTVLITFVEQPSFDKATGAENPAVVNVAGWSSEGDAFARRGVVVGEEFHLNRDCPSSL